MSRLVAVGDIHGCADTFRSLLERASLGRGDTLVTIGDLSSKGIDSYSVHQQLLDLESTGVEVVPLLGNHELMLLAMQRFIGAPVSLEQLPASFLEDAEVEFLIRQNGTWATLKSYGLDGIDRQDLWAFQGTHPREHFCAVSEKVADMPWQLPAAHLDLLSRCRTHYLARNCLFVHAGLNPKFLLSANAGHAVQSQLDDCPRDLCWNRDWLGMTPEFPELLIHGHTPLSYLYARLPTTDPWKDNELVFKSVVYDGALNLDSGAFLESGHLTAVEIPEDGNPQSLDFIRIPRRDPVEKDRLWYVNHM